MMASGIWDLGAPGGLYWLRTGWPVAFSMAAGSKNPRAAGVAMTWTRPAAFVGELDEGADGGGRACAAHDDRQDARVRVVGHRVIPIWLANCSASRRMLGGAVVMRSRTSRWTDGRPVTSSGAISSGGAQGDAGLLVPSPLQERAGGVDQQAGFPLGHGDGAQVDAAGHVDGGARVAEGDGDVDPVLPGVDRAEGGPAEIAVGSEPLGGVVGLGEQFVGGSALVVLGGCDRAAQQQRSVDRQGLGVVGGDVVVEPLGVAAGGGDGRRRGGRRPSGYG